MIDKIKNFFNDDFEDEEDDLIDGTFVQKPRVTKTSGGVKNNVNAIHNRIKKITPVTYNSADDIITDLREGCAVIIDFEKLSDDESIRLYSNLSGALIALDGHLETLSDNIVLCSPNNFIVEIER